jgi:predicted DNA-binding transcriptional regulator YafY
MIGVSRSTDSQSIEIKLRFSAQRIEYVKTKPIHGASQRLDKADFENRTIIINLIPNRELYQNLLSFGDDVEVIYPIEVRNKMKEKALKMYNLYVN